LARRRGCVAAIGAACPCPGIGGVFEVGVEVGAQFELDWRHGRRRAAGLAVESYKQSTLAQISKFRCEMSRNAIACLQGHLRVISWAARATIGLPANANISRLVDKPKDKRPDYKSRGL